MQSGILLGRSSHRNSELTEKSAVAQLLCTNGGSSRPLLTAASTYYKVRVLRSRHLLELASRLTPAAARKAVN